MAPAKSPAEVPSPTPSEPREASPVKPTVIMREEDAYIHERIATQPQSLEDLAKVQVYTDTEKNRLQLPDYFEAFSHDCTVANPKCRVHTWTHDKEKNRWSYSNRGKFIFRWVKNTKRAIDVAMNVNNWAFVNRRLFKDAPTHLFSANGGVELGDVILFVLPAEQALKLRNAPGQRSTEILKSRMTKTERGKVVMTGNLDNENFYVPESGGEEEGDDASAPGLVEERDF